MISALLAGLFLAAPGQAAPNWATFEIINSDALRGHVLLHLEDVLGARARPKLLDLPKVQAVVLFSTTPKDCTSKKGFCALALQLMGLKEVLVLGVLLHDPQTGGADLKGNPSLPQTYPIAHDPHGLVWRALKVDRPGVFVVVNSNMQVSRYEAPRGQSAGAVADRFIAGMRTRLEKRVLYGREVEDKNEK